MKKIEYKNKMYYFSDHGWINATGGIVEYATNLILNIEYVRNSALDSLSFEEIEAIAVSYENNRNYDLAISAIETHLESVKDFDEKCNLITRLIGYNRRIIQPHTTIQIFSDNLYSLQFNCAALTSVAAAYIDVDDKSNAKIYNTRAKKYARTKQEYTYVKKVRSRFEKDK